MRLYLRYLCSMMAVGVLAIGSLASAEARVGQAAPAFSLQDQDGKTVSLSDFSGKIVVLEWTNPECPFVIRHYKAKTMSTLADKNSEKVVWLAINSSHFNTKADSKKWIEQHGLKYPTLDDASGEVGKLYGAKSTPHMFIIDTEGKVAYSGAIDDDPRGQKSDKVNYVETAIGELQAGQPVSTPETKPYGCSMKYK
jgi:peroxiredoxin